MPHWKSLYIEHFRRLENLRLDELGSVNLLVGKNNSGKTSVLEALAIASHPFSPLTWINTAWEREVKSARTPVLEVLNWMFPHKAPRPNGFDGTVVISGQLQKAAGNDLGLFPAEEIRILADYREFRELSLSQQSLSDDTDAEEASEYAAKLEIRVERMKEEGGQWEVDLVKHESREGKFPAETDRPALLPHQFVSPVSHRTNPQLLAALDQVLVDRSKDKVVELLGKFANDVDDVEIRSPEGRRAVIHLHHKELGHVPLAVEGDGMRRALAFASAVSLAKGGVLLLDEVETALHPDALGGMFRFLVQACRDTQVQLFVTTHSLEAVDAILESVAGDDADLVAYRLPGRFSGQSLKRFGSQTLRDLRHEGGLDIR